MKEASGQLHRRERIGLGRCVGVGGGGYARALDAAAGRTGEMAGPAGDAEVAPDQGLPPRKLRPELNGPTQRQPQLHWLSDAPIVEARNPRLPTQPRCANPTRAGLTDLSEGAHHSFCEHLQTEQAGWPETQAGGCERRRAYARQVSIPSPDRSSAEWQGAFHDCSRRASPLGQGAGWRDCCLVIRARTAQPIVSATVPG